MDWQDYVVWAIGIAVAAVVAVWLWRLVCGRRRGGCAACPSAQCPHKKFNKKN